MKRSVLHTTGMALSEAWQTSLQEMHAREMGVIAGDDAEELHRFRVALRTTRALLRLFQHYLPEPESFVGEFAWLSDALSPVRDLDIVAQFVQHSADQSPQSEQRTLAACKRALARQRVAQRKTLQTLLCSRRYRRLLKNWQVYIERRLQGAELPIALHVRSKTSQRVIALEQILKLLRRLRRIDSAAAQLHRMRIRCKRLRYLFDALPVADNDKKFAALRKALVRLQRILGEHQDAVVIRAWFAQLAGQSKSGIEIPSAWYEAVEQQQRSARAELPRAWRVFVDACAEI